MDAINLRGHHIGTLAAYYYNGNSAGSQYEEIKGYLGRIDEKSRKRILAAIIFERTSQELYDRIITEPNLNVQVVEGLDSICKSGCPIPKPSCFEDSKTQEDRRTAESYGLKIGESYSAKEILERIAEFRRKTGFSGPRSQWLNEVASR